MQPRDFFQSPELFGDITARLEPEFDVAEHEMLHKIHAARLQNALAYSVESVMKSKAGCGAKSPRTLT